MNWATEYLNSSQTTKVAVSPFGKPVNVGIPHLLPAGILAATAGGGLAGALAHGHGQEDVRRKLIEAGSTPEEIARADYLAKGPKAGYGFGDALQAGAVGAGTGMATNWALRRATGMKPGLARGLGLGAGLGAAYLASRSSAEGAERRRMKGQDY